MACAHPLHLRYKDYGTITVPCGNCVCCKSLRALVWSDRIRAEVHDNYKSCLFLTLTYSDDFVPYAFNEDGDVRETLSPLHFNGFIKGLRNRLYYFDKSTRFKFFGCGEYGGKFGRPHYHLLLMGLPNVDFIHDCVKRLWTFGHFDISAPRSTEDVVNYVTGYVLKKYSGKVALEKYGVSIPPFQRSSKNIGLTRYLQRRDKIIEDGGLMVRGKLHPIPHSILSRPAFEPLAKKLKSQFFLNNLVHADPDKEDRDLVKALKRENELKTLSRRNK